VGVADISPVAVDLPGGGNELHWPLRAGDAVVDHPAELRLDQVDGREVIRTDPEAPLGLVVEPDKVRERRPPPELELLVLGAGGEPQERAPRGVEPADLGAKRAAEQRHNARGEVWVVAEEGDPVRQDGGPFDNLRGRCARGRITRGTPGVDCLAEGRVVLSDLVGNLLWRRRGGAVATPDQTDDRDHSDG
jgi:hypothetical protein